MRGQQIVYETLNRLGIRYDGMEHTPVFTVEEMDRLAFPPDVVTAKNLFLRDARGRRHFLVVLRKDKPVNLRGLEEPLSSSRLSFASEERLHKHLGLTKGSVSPLGILNDGERAVEVVFDRDLAAAARVGVHPNDNAAMLFLAFDDLVRLAEERGNKVFYI